MRTRLRPWSCQGCGRQATRILSALSTKGPHAKGEGHSQDWQEAGELGLDGELEARMSRDCRQEHVLNQRVPSVAAVSPTCSRPRE